MAEEGDEVLKKPLRKDMERCWGCWWARAGSRLAGTERDARVRLELARQTTLTRDGRMSGAGVCLLYVSEYASVSVSVSM